MEHPVAIAPDRACTSPEYYNAEARCAFGRTRTRIAWVVVRRDQVRTERVGCPETHLRTTPDGGNYFQLR